jgi:molecular chaperone DnaK (HSP70)
MPSSQSTQHPIDYLDSIATVPKGAAKKVNDKLFFGLIIGGVLAALVVGGLALLNGGSSSKDDLIRLSVRFQNLQTVSDKSSKTIVSSSLRATNTNLSLALASANRDSKKALVTLGADSKKLDPKKLDPKITEQEKTEELDKKLTNARMNATFDRTYAREMTYQLDTLLVLIDKTESKTKDTSVKEFLQTTRRNLKPLQKQFAEFTAESS